MSTTAKRPRRAPLREIVDWAPHFSLAGYGAAVLSCGHEKIQRRGSHPRRTRCEQCLDGKPAKHPHDCIGRWPDDPLGWCRLCQAERAPLRTHFMLPRIPGAQRVGGVEALCSSRSAGPISMDGNLVTCPDCYARLLELHRKFRGSGP